MWLLAPCSDSDPFSDLPPTLLPNTSNTPTSSYLSCCSFYLEHTSPRNQPCFRCLAKCRISGSLPWTLFKTATIPLLSVTILLSRVTFSIAYVHTYTYYTHLCICSRCSPPHSKCRDCFTHCHLSSATPRMTHWHKAGTKHVLFWWVTLHNARNWGNTKFYRNSPCPPLTLGLVEEFDNC